MRPSFAPYALSAALLLGGCHSVPPATDEANKRYAHEYRQTVSEASNQGLLDSTSTDAKRLHAVTDRLLAQVKKLRPESSQWQWEVNLIRKEELNATSWPGGKILVYTGLITTLELTDDEIAAMMGNVIASAFNEMPQAYSSGALTGVFDSLLGISDEYRELADLSITVNLREYTRLSNEKEADLFGLELAARAGYNPNAAVTLWQKLIENVQAPEYGGEAYALLLKNRLASFKAAVPEVMPLYQNARGF